MPVTRPTVPTEEQTVGSVATVHQANKSEQKRENEAPENEVNKYSRLQAEQNSRPNANKPRRL